MKMRIICLSFVIVLSLSGQILSDSTATHRQTERDSYVKSAIAMEKAFIGSGAGLASVKATVWGECIQDYTGTTGIDRLARRLKLSLSKEWGLIKSSSSKARAEDGYRLTLEGLREESQRLKVTVVSPKGLLGSLASSIIVEVSSDKRLHHQLEKVLSLAYSTAHMACVKPSVTLMISGQWNKMLDDLAKDKVLKGMFKQLSASVNGRYNVSSHVNVSAFSPKLHNSVNVGVDRVNFNVAIRDNMLSRKSLLVMASPVILDEY